MLRGALLRCTLRRTASAAVAATSALVATSPSSPFVDDSAALGGGVAPTTAFQLRHCSSSSARDSEGDFIDPATISFVCDDTDAPHRDSHASDDGAANRSSGEGNHHGADENTRGGASVTDTALSFEDVPKLDPYSRAKVLNFIRRQHSSSSAGSRSGPSAAAASASASSEDSGLFEVREVRSSDATHFHARLRVTFPAPHGVRIAEGLGTTAKDAETLAAMHAELLIDALGYSVYNLATMQRKHAEAARAAGRWAPLPAEDASSSTEQQQQLERRRASQRHLPLPLRNIVDRDESEGGRWALLDTTTRHFRTSPHALLSPAVFDPAAVSRIRKLFQANRMTFDEILQMKEVTPLSRETAKMFEATVVLSFLPATYGRVVASGKAIDKQTAQTLACMHCELVVDALGFPLFPQNTDLQVQHARAVQSYGRSAPMPTDEPAPPGSSIPLPLKQLVLAAAAASGGVGASASAAAPVGSAATAASGTAAAAAAPVSIRVSAPSAEELLISNHVSLAEQVKTFATIVHLDPDCVRLLLDFMKRSGTVRNDPFFVEKVGTVFRATVVLPLPIADFGLRGSIGIADLPEEAEILAAMHAIEILNLVGVAVHADPVTQAAYVERRQRSNLPVPGEESRQRLRPSPAAFRKVVAFAQDARTGGAASVAAATAEKAAQQRSDARQQRLREMAAAAAAAAASTTSATVVPTPTTATPPATPGLPLPPAGGSSLPRPGGGLGFAATPVLNTQHICWKTQQKTVPKHHWCLEADTHDGFILVSPKQKLSNSASFGHTLVSPRQLDMLAKERIVAYLASVGKKAHESVKTTKIVGYDEQVMYRCVINLFVPHGFGERLAVGEAPDAKEAELLAAMHAELTFDVLGLPLFMDAAQQRKHAEAARRVGRFAAFPGDSAQPLSTPSPPALRKEREDSVRWLKHVQQRFGKEALVQLQEDEELREKKEAELTSFETLGEEALDSNSKARVQNYLRRVTKSATDPVQYTIEASVAATNHVARFDLPVPQKFGARVAIGMGLTKKDAETLCYMHAERLLDALGIHVFNLPGLQRRHVERVKGEGRSAPPLLDEDFNKPGNTPSPRGLRIHKGGPKPKYPTPPSIITKRAWDDFIVACEKYIDSKVRHLRDLAIANERVPRTGEPLIDETLDDVEKREVERQAKSTLFNYCFRTNLTPPSDWSCIQVGPAGARKTLTTIEVPGFPHVRAFGLAGNKDTSARRCAMHAIALIKRLDPDFASVDAGGQAEAALQNDMQQAQKKKHDMGSWDRLTGSFTPEGKTRLVELYTVCNGLQPPRVVHRQKQDGSFVMYSTTVEVVDCDDMRYVGRAEQQGRKMNVAAAFDDLFHRMVHSIPAFRSLMQLLRKHPHLDPEHIMSIAIPKGIETRIADATEGMDVGGDGLSNGPEGEDEWGDEEAVEGDRSVDATTQRLVDAATTCDTGDGTMTSTMANALSSESAVARQKMLKERADAKELNPQYVEKFHARRTSLSIHDSKQKILDAVRDNPVVVICGTTGCGKTTQVPQFLLDDAVARGCGADCSILVTQPRRISAISIAQRIAAERLESIGDEVGYTIRLESKPGRSINFCTSGVLLRVFNARPNLDGIKYIIIDEIHERDINSDFLLILVKDVVQRRPDIRIILMSATLQSELFSGFFGGAPVINVEGYVFPVKELFLEDIAAIAKERGVPASSFKKALTTPSSASFVDESNNDEYDPSAPGGNAMQRQQRQQQQRPRYGFSEASDGVDYNAVKFAVENVAKAEDLSGGSILVFLPGWEEIVKTRDMLSTGGQFHVVTLHSSVSSQEQMLCFLPPPAGKIKLVLSTNVAESGVTIDDIAAVIDVGLAKEKSFVLSRGRTSVGRNELRSVSQLVTVFASRANCVQRRGRAGRTRVGVCYRMYTRKHFAELADFQTPEMLRQPLDTLCLQIMSLGLGDPMEFLQRALEPPPMESIEAAMTRLRNLGAINNNRALTALGLRLSKLPVVPSVGKMILLGAVLHCLDSALTIAATTDLDPFIAHRDHKDLVRVHREEVSCNSQSDQIAAINAYNMWATAKALKTTEEVADLVKDNLLHLQSLQSISKYKRQFYDILASSGFLGEEHKYGGQYHRRRNGFGRRAAAATEAFVEDSPFSADATEVALVKGVICAGLFPNVVIAREKKLYRSKLENLLSPHPGSVINKLRGEDISNPYFVYNEIMKSPTDARMFFRGGSNVSMWALLLLGTSNTHIGFRSDLNLGIIDDWIVFRATGETLSLLRRLKSRLNQCISKKFVAPDDLENNSLLDKLREIISSLVSLPTKPNDLVATVWEERGLITEAVAATGEARGETEDCPSASFVGSSHRRDANQPHIGNDDDDDDAASSSDDDAASALDAHMKP